MANALGTGTDVAIPKLEQLSKVIESVNDQLQQKVLEVEQEHNINTKQRWREERRA